MATAQKIEKFEGEEIRVLIAQVHSAFLTLANETGVVLSAYSAMRHGIAYSGYVPERLIRELKNVEEKLMTAMTELSTAKGLDEHLKANVRLSEELAQMSNRPVSEMERREFAVLNSFGERLQGIISSISIIRNKLKKARVKLSNYLRRRGANYALLTDAGKLFGEADGLIEHNKEILRGIYSVLYRRFIYIDEYQKQMRQRAAEGAKYVLEFERRSGRPVTWPVPL